MSRTVKELTAELEDIREGLHLATAKPYSLEILDLEFISDRVKDIKRELRVAKAKE